MILVLVLFGGFAGGVGPYQWGHGYGGNYGVGGIRLVLIILVVLLLIGRI